MTIEHDAVPAAAGHGGRSSVATKWVNAGPDEGALHALLDHVTERIPRERIDLLWVFPPRIAAGAESTVMVLAAFDDDPDRRTVATAHFRVTRDRRGRATVTLQMQEHGSAPVGATQRVVDGVLRRLGDEVGRDAPRRAEIRGEADAWWALYQEVGGEVAAEIPVEAGSDDADPAPADGGTEAAPSTAANSDSDSGTDGLPPADDGTETPPHGDALAGAHSTSAEDPTADHLAPRESIAEEHS